MRLLTVRRYGITYGVIGSLLTMATFARVRANGILEFWSLNLVFLFTVSPSLWQAFNVLLLNGTGPQQAQSDTAVNDVF